VGKRQKKESLQPTGNQPVMES
jgi:hypothetical protein